MAPSLDCAMSSLLCAEETDSIYFDEGVEEFQTTLYHKTSKNLNFEFKEGCINSLLPLQSDEFLDLMFKKECEHLPASDYSERLRNGALDLKARQEAVNWIGKVRVCVCVNSYFVYFELGYFTFEVDVVCLHYQNVMFVFWADFGLY